MDEKTTAPDAAPTPGQTPVEPAAQEVPAAPTPAAASADTSTPADAPAPAPGQETPQAAPAAPAPTSYEASYGAAPAPTAQPAAAPAPTAAAPYPGTAQTGSVSPTPALVCGILAIVLSGLPIAGIALGIVAIVLAGRYYNAGGTEGTAKGGKICGIIGIVLSVIMIIVATALVVIGMNELKNTDVTAGRSASISTTERSTAPAPVDEEDQPLYDAADPSMQQIADLDPAMVASVADVMQISFDEAMASGEWDITLASCGVDPQEMARAMMEGFTYEPYYASADDGTAKVTYKVTVRSIFDVGDDLFDEMSDILTGVNAGITTEEEAAPLIGEALMAAIQDNEPEGDNIWDIELVQSGDAWVIDQASWDEEMDYFFAFI